MSIELTVKGIRWTTEVHSHIEWDGLPGTLYYYYFDQFDLSERITVLDRMTGSYLGRDIETGHKDREGKFWLASGSFDIRKFPELTLAEAVEKIKANANSCRGK
jgi:hypothetical protein